MKSKESWALKSLSSLDLEILALLEERERLLTCLADTKDSQDNRFSPFSHEFARTSIYKAKAGKYFFSGFRVNYVEHSKLDIAVRQCDPEDQLLSPPDHNYELVLALSNTQNASWVSVEKELGTVDNRRPSFLNLQIKFRLDGDAKKLPISYSIYKQESDDSYSEIFTQGFEVPSHDWHSHIQSLNLHEHYNGLDDPAGLSALRLAIFLPVYEGLNARFSMISTFLSQGSEYDS